MRKIYRLTCVLGKNMYNWVQDYKYIHEVNHVSYVQINL